MYDTPSSIIDLSNPIHEDIPVFPEFPMVRCEKTNWAARDVFTMEHIEMRSHTGTHIDAPLHFIPEAKSLDEFPLTTFMGEGIVLDITPKEPGEPITVDDIEPHENEINADDVVMLHTGWDQYYGLTTEYLFEYPYLTKGASTYLGELGLKAVGVDTMSVAGWVGEAPNQDPVAETHPADSHIPLLENEVIPIEEIRNLDQVLDGETTKRAYFLYPPLNFEGVGGAPVRAFAFV